MRRVPMMEPDRCLTRDVRTSGMLVDGDEYYRAFHTAAWAARKYILLVGWQFDTDVEILRGDPAKSDAHGDVRLLPLLNQLCEDKPDLHIYLLAWDYSFIYSLEREWLQKVSFEWAGHPRVHFRFDSHHPIWGAHHQKYIVVDGEVGFIGGLDLCEHRWDDRCHKAVNPLRTKSSGLSYKPFHDIQAYVVGPDAGAALVEHFRSRWRDAGCGEVELPELARPAHPDLRFSVGVPFAAHRVAFHETRPRHNGSKPQLDVAELFREAIHAADELVYVETQYFSARAMLDALVRRMRTRRRPRLDIVLVLPQRPGEIKERFAIGLAQAKTLQVARKVAAETGHRFGVYYAVDNDELQTPTYIHSKLLIVDDSFISIGSANFTNRSMGVDTELHASFIAEGADAGVIRRSIRHARVSLLAEHIGAHGPSAVRPLLQTRGLVGYLDRLAADRNTRLRLQQEVNNPEEVILQYVDVEKYNFFDPTEPPLPIDEQMGREWKEAFAAGITSLSRKMLGGDS